MDLKSGDPEPVRAACLNLRDLAVAAEGPGAPFTATHRGQQLLRLIHVVVQNVGLEDKVGALTALRLLKADDTLLQKLLKEGILPPLLGILSRDAEQHAWDERQYEISEVETFAETSAAAARTIEAFSSSGDSLTTLLRGGAVEVLTNRLTRVRGELADSHVVFTYKGVDSAERRERINKLRAQTAAACSVALARISGSNLLGASEEVVFGKRTDDSTPIPHAQTVAATSTARSLLCLLTSDAVVAHKASSAGLANLAKSGRAGRVASSKCGAVLPLMTAALAGNAGQRAAALDALAAIVEGSKDGRKIIPTRGDHNQASGHDVSMAADDLDMMDENTAAGEMEMDDGGGVRGADDASHAAKEAERAATTAVNANQNQKTNASVLGTAGKVGEMFFKRLIGVLTELLTLRGALERSAADAALALWALAWQPSNRRHMRDGQIVFPLIVLYREGSVAAADDAGAVLGVLARMDPDCANLIQAIPTHGPGLLQHLIEKDAQGSESPSASSPKNGSNHFSFEDAANNDNGPSNLSTSPSIRRTISGNHVAAAVARASPK